MATIILAKDGTMLHAFPLLKARTTIGRRTYNDIVIDAPGISAEHAVIVTSPHETYFEDMESTNGSQLNGQPISKHFLQDGDVIELASHTIQYRTDESTLDMPPQPVSVRVDIDSLSDMQQTVPLAEAGTPRAVAAIRILNGFGAGREIPLTRTMTTVGRPGLQVAVLTKTTQGCNLAHLEGAEPPRVNGVSIGTATHALANGDVIEMSGTEMMFLL